MVLVPRDQYLILPRWTVTVDLAIVTLVRVGDRFRLGPLPPLVSDVRLEFANHEKFKGCEYLTSLVLVQVNHTVSRLPNRLRLLRASCNHIESTSRNHSYTLNNRPKLTTILPSSILTLDISHNRIFMLILSSSTREIVLGHCYDYFHVRTRESLISMSTYICCKKRLNNEKSIRFYELESTSYAEWYIFGSKGVYNELRVLQGMLL